MATLENKTILVIGATGGLGRHFVQQLAESGASVISASSTDLNLESADSIERFAAHVSANYESIDGIVLAAGQVAFGSIAETPPPVRERLTRVNFLGQVDLVSALLPALTTSAEAGSSPFVLSISGVIAESPMAGLAAYSASKTALLGYAQAAARELRRASIRWIDARPGHTETGLAGRAIFGQAPAFGAGLEPAAVVARMIEAIKNDEKDLPSGSFLLA
ncbi:MAG: SDR family NAD(P)-dependent oxidoreductase [Rhodoluna sp.]|nr:SDR family NAD(P)-dependent oxidoreductase [Rhodoluna sp.]MBP6186379.1 SDR family NAD(P)-dependent oxidoreductase [Rhodoluna sp.]